MEHGWATARSELRRPACSVGIDVAKDHVDVAVQPGGAPGRVSHDAAGLAQVVARLDALAPVLVVLEASGG
jgi:transposase